jgi:hypothetical protein
MSHIVQIQTQVTSEAAVQAACRRLQLAPAVHATVTLFSAKSNGLVVRLPAWRYPLVCDLATGTIQFDNFEGAWGEQRELDKFLQAYAVERATLEARARGHWVTETSLADGSVKLTLRVGGAA